MKIKEFSAKYGIPYPIVQRASFRIRLPIYQGRRSVNYVESELGKAVVEELRHTIQYHMKFVENAGAEYDKIRCISWDTEEL